jgi:glycosyltransferase involved in cell wall biosynthesis
MNVVILTPALTEGDAVSNDVFGMARTLRADGHRVALSVRWASPEIPVVPLAQVSSLLSHPNDVLIYHLSVGCEEGVRLVEELPCRKIVKYHNVTPPRFFKELSSDTARVCAEGIAQLGRVLRPDIPVWVDSDFNGRELVEAHPGQDYQVLPPFNQAPRLLEIEPDLTAVGNYDDWFTNVLVVGRLAPNKNPNLAVDAFAAYCEKHDRHARLVFAGPLLQNAFFESVQERIRERGLTDRVVLTGKVSPAQLKAFYLTAQVLLTTSSHEGFCVPLVEAMALRVPIVAVRNGAIPDTGGDVAVYADDDAEQLADALAAVRADLRKLEERLDRGWRRYEGHFADEAIAGQFRALAGRICNATAPVLVRLQA